MTYEATINAINKMFQNVSFENSSLWKHVVLAKRPKRKIVLNAK